MHFGEAAAAATNPIDDAHNRRTREKTNPRKHSNAVAQFPQEPSSQYLDRNFDNTKLLIQL
jgi:hypothetical protein